jgi:hypothetical protein
LGRRKDFFSLFGEACLGMDMCVNEGSWLWMNTYSLFDMILDNNSGFKKNGKMVMSWWTQTTEMALSLILCRWE